MRLYGKVFLSILLLVSISFGVFGAILIQSSFQSAWNREVEIGKNENQMLKFTLETALNTIPGDAGSEYYKSNEIANVVNSVRQGMRLQDAQITLINADKEIVYTSNKQEQGIVLYDAKYQKVNEKLFDQVTSEQSGYQVYQQKNQYYLTVMSMIDTRLMETGMRLETTVNITHIYKERAQMMRTYRYVMMGVLFGVVIVAVVLSYFLTRSVRHLSKVTRQFADGDLDSRAKVKSRDEVGMLADDFNQMADELQNRVLSLEDQAKRQEEFTAAFAHELKTPLTSIIGYADMLRSMNLTEAERMKASDYIYSQGKRLESLSYKLLELLVLKKQKFEQVKLDADFLVENVYDLTEVGVREKGITLNKHVAQGVIYGEKDLLVSLFANLIDNSKKASESGTNIWIKGEQREDGYAITVEDEGRGMTEEELGRITEAFYMVDKSRSRKEGGAGLGMTLCNQIVALHGASWEMESELGRGTCITVIFPKEVI
ncbi:MAG: HAMP domain-containing sensor histidine kinase [Lachnospiraceae bacterium]|nr:HAMP domain-containing sensor histidine kinase [Lachnospiraceae bacterium]